LHDTRAIGTWADDERPRQEHALTKTRALAVLAVVAALALAPPSAHGSSFSFTGTFSHDDDVRQITFDVGAPSMVTLRTWSYAGGTNAAGTVVPRGGFDPVVALFDSTGGLIEWSDDGPCAVVGKDAVTDRCRDSYLSISLQPGLYTTSVTEYDNVPRGPSLANGFSESGHGDFTPSLTHRFVVPCPDPQSSFVDLSGVAGGCGRTGAWALDILNVGQVASVPEPAGIGMLVVAWAALGLATWCIPVSSRAVRAGRRSDSLCAALSAKRH
jgi:hypothetical protein